MKSMKIPILLTLFVGGVLGPGTGIFQVLPRIANAEAEFPVARVEASEMMGCGCAARFPSPTERENSRPKVQNVVTGSTAKSSW